MRIFWKEVLKSGSYEFMRSMFNNPQNAIYLKSSHGRWPIKCELFRRSPLKRFIWMHACDLCPLFPQNAIYIQWFHRRWPKVRTFSQKSWKAVHMDVCDRCPIFHQNVTYLQWSHSRWPKVRTLLQSDLCSIFHKMPSISSHLTADDLKCGLFGTSS